MFSVASRGRTKIKDRIDRNFSSIKGEKKKKSFLTSRSIQIQNRLPRKTESKFIQKVDNHLAHSFRKRF